MRRLIVCLVLLLSAFGTVPAHAVHVVACRGVAPQQPTCEKTFVAEYNISGSGVTQGGIFVALEGVATSGSKTSVYTCEATACTSLGASFKAGDVVTMRVVAVGVGFYEYRLRYNHW